MTNTLQVARRFSVKNNISIRKHIPPKLLLSTLIFINLTGCWSTAERIEYCGKVYPYQDPNVVVYGLEKTYTYGDICPLHYAESAEDIQSLIEDGYSVNMSFADGTTPLHMALNNGRLLDVIEALLASGADVNAKNNVHQETPLHMALNNGRLLDVIEALLASGADVNAKNNAQETTLHMAVSKGAVDTVKALIASGADVNAKNNAQETPLHMAVKRANVNTVKALLASETKISEELSFDMLSYAAKQNKNEIFETILASLDNSDKNQNIARSKTCAETLSDNNYLSLCIGYHTENLNDSEKQDLLYNICNGTSVAHEAVICATTPEQILLSEVQHCPGEGAPEGSMSKLKRDGQILHIEACASCINRYSPIIDPVYDDDKLVKVIQQLYIQLEKDQSEYLAEGINRRKQLEADMQKEIAEIARKKAEAERQMCHLTSWTIQENSYYGYYLHAPGLTEYPEQLPLKCSYFVILHQNAAAHSAMGKAIDSYDQEEISLSLIKCYNEINYPRVNLKDVAIKCNGKWW